MAAPRPPLELEVEITSTDGTRYRWDAQARGADDRPTALKLSSATMEGFKTMSCALARRIDLDYRDLHLFDDVAVIGADGSTAWEGRVASIPRSVGDSHQIAIDAVGWMAHMKDRRFRMTFVDRNLSAWTGMSNARRAFLLTNNRRIDDMSLPSDSSQHAIVTAFQGPWSSPYNPRCEGWYDIGAGQTIGTIYVNPQLVSGIDPTDSNWGWTVAAANDDGAGIPWSTPRPATGYYAPSAPYRLACLLLDYAATPAGGADTTYEVDWRDVAVYGNHGLPLIGTDPQGVAASDVIRYLVGQYCPKINADGVLPTTYPISQLNFSDSTFPYDAALQVNGYHLWNLAVWENRRLCFEPFDLSDYDWEVRLSDPGVTVDLQGDTTDGLANGIEVTYTDAVTGKPARLTPGDTPELADASVSNEANRHGLQVWTSIDISDPVPQEDAIQLGVVALAEYNQPKAPGTITTRGGHVRDRAGHWQQAWKVRGSHRVAITDHPNSRPRLITEAGWDHDTKTLTIATDSTLKRVDAILDRFGTALTAAGLA